MAQNPFNTNEDAEIREGFICPMCKDDLKDVESLLKHFETKHQEDKETIKSFLDIFNIAKKKIMNFDDNELAGSLKTSMNLMGNQNWQQERELVQEIQNIGLLIDHFSYFKAIRNPRLERYATETNQLIIRLNKLLTDRPTDPSLIKQHEQNLVPWIDGKLVKLCPSCAKSFFLTRRQHHCRLCGSIMCNECSCFLSMDDANSIINPSYEKLEPSEASGKEKEFVDNIRLCVHCLHLLENRKEMQDSRSVRPTITKLYERIERIKKEVAPDLVIYEKIIKSLYEGDSVYTLNDAGSLRGKVGQMAEVIDTLSKELLMIKVQKGSREESLQKSIRIASIKFIKENMLTIAPIPLEEEIKRIQQLRIQELSMKIERDRRLAQEAFERYELETTSSGPVLISKRDHMTRTAMTTVDNWSGYQATSNQQHQHSLNDPLVEQIIIIKGYIKQAREAMRFEEVKTLDENLRELQQEFYIRQQQQAES